MGARHSLVFLTYNNPVLIDTRLDEVDEHLSQRQDVEVFVTNNGSEDHGVRLALISRSQMFRIPISIHNIKKNVGFGPGFNKAVDRTDGDIVHLISSDVHIFGDFIEVLGEFEPREVICHERISHAAGWNEFGDEEPIAYPSGYYLAMYRSTWDTLGGFDKRFAPYDYEDLDLGYRIAKSDDFSLIERANLPLRHHAASTIGYGDGRHEQTVTNRAKFAEKWGLPNVPERP